MACQEEKIEAPDGKDVDVTVKLGVVWGDKMLKRLQEDITENLSLSSKVRRLEQQISTIIAKLNQETKDVDGNKSAKRQNMLT